MSNICLFSPELSLFGGGDWHAVGKSRDFQHPVKSADR
jgi:hypothetical protein